MRMCNGRKIKKKAVLYGLIAILLAAVISARLICVLCGKCYFFSKDAD